jgi:hypothetical protein
MTVRADGFLPRTRAARSRVYGDDGEAVGEPGDQRSYYHWLGTGQMFRPRATWRPSSLANLGEWAVRPRIAGSDGPGAGEAS